LTAKHARQLLKLPGVVFLWVAYSSDEARFRGCE